MSETGNWSRKDRLIAFAILATGVLVTACSWLMLRNIGFTLGLAPCLGLPMGVLMVVGGAIGVYQALRDRGAP